MDADERDLTIRLEACGEGGSDADRAALLCDLADLKLQRGEQEEARELLKQAYELREDNIHAPAPAAAASAATAVEEEAADGGAAAADGGSEDDWENDWEAGIGNLKSADDYAREDAAAAAAATAAAAASSTRGRGQAAFVPANAASADGADDRASSTAAPRLPHVVELYDLTKAVGTANLEAFLADYAAPDGGVPELRWVDDEHALAVFPNAEAASSLLAAPTAGRCFKARPFSEACGKSQELTAEELPPPRAGPRPKTTAVVARRLIGAALGMREVRDRDGERALAALRREAREGRQVKKQEQAAVWGD